MKFAPVLAAALMGAVASTALAGPRSLDTTGSMQVIGMTDIALCVLETERDNINDAFYWCSRTIRRGEASAAERAVAYMHRGVLNLKTHDVKAAMGDIDQALSLAPDYGDAYFNRANAKFAMGQYQEAVEDYTRALENRPTTPELAHYNRGKAYERLGKSDLAKADMAQAQTLMPKDSPIAGRFTASGK